MNATLRALLLLAAIASSYRLAAQTTQPESGARMRFDVASVKPSAPGSGAGFNITPGRLIARNIRLIDYVAYAFSIEPGRIVGEQSDILSEGYDVAATFTTTTSSTPIRAMLRTLLEERFLLRAAPARNQMSVYVLVKARTDEQFGPRLKRVTTDCTKRDAGKPAPCRIVDGTDRFAASGLDWKTLNISRYLTPHVDRLVVDRTGLVGQFDIDLEFAPDPLRFRDAPPADRDAPDRPTIFTAIREQLGLRLEAQTEFVDVLSVEHVQRPSPD